MKAHFLICYALEMDRFLLEFFVTFREPTSLLIFVFWKRLNFYVIFRFSIFCVFFSKTTLSVIRENHSDYFNLSYY